MKKTVLVLLALLGLACGGAKEETAQAPEPIVVGPEDAAVVTRGPIETGPSLTGTLTAEEQATVRSQLAGSVLEAFAEPGQPVRRGQLLARLDATSLTDASNSARAAVTNAQQQRAGGRARGGAPAGARARPAPWPSATWRRRPAVRDRRPGRPVPGPGAARQRPEAARLHTRSPRPSRAWSARRGSRVATWSSPGRSSTRWSIPRSWSWRRPFRPKQLAGLTSGRARGAHRHRLWRPHLPGADHAHQPLRGPYDPPGAGLRRDPQHRQRAGEPACSPRGGSPASPTTGLTLPSGAIDRRMARPAVIRVRGGKVETGRGGAGPGGRTGAAGGGPPRRPAG